MDSLIKQVKKKYIFLLVFIFILSPFKILNAQSKYNDDIEKAANILGSFQLYNSGDFITEIYPEIPGPQEEVHLHLVSYVFNLNNYYIAWFLNGKKIKEGYGERDFYFTTGKQGEVTRVKAVIEIGNRIFTKEYRFSPAVVDILWEAEDAYTPPFYRGKALPLMQGKIRVVAIPETRVISPKNSNDLVYYWKRNKKNVIKYSGYGRNSYTFDADPLAYKERIEVTVNNKKESSFARNEIEIPVKDFKAKILFYRYDDNYRVLTNKALNTFGYIDGDSVHLSFHPLNLSTTEPNFIDLFVGWSINGEERPPQDFGKQEELSITTDGKSGEVEIGLTLEQIKKILQSAKEKIILNFSGIKSSKN